MMWKKLRNSCKQQGAALTVTLLVMMVLVLLALSLIIQSNTEQLIAQNEEDSVKALAGAESIVWWGNRLIRDYVVNSRPLDLDPILNGTFNGSATGNVVGFRTVDPLLTDTSDLTDGNEEGSSGVDANDWEFFRLGEDLDADGNFDGNVRTLIRARLEDNYDAGGAFPDVNDSDLRLRLVVEAEYPVFVDANGVEITSTAVRPRAIRRIIARFGPTGALAIRTDGSLDIWGSSELCGECGSAHANENIIVGHSGDTQVDVCGEATGTGSAAIQPTITVVGDKGLSPEVFIPIINPYNPEFIPRPEYFDTSTDFTLIPDLRCPAPSLTDPGASKFFALVRTTTGSAQGMQVYKAYPDTGMNRWVWRLIDQKVTGSENLNAVLDNCGRVVVCGSDAPGCTPDQRQVGGVWTPANNGVTDGGNNEFYAWDGNQPYGTEACVGDEISGAIAGAGDRSNDWNPNDWPVVTSITYPGGGNAIIATSGIGTPAYGVPVLPTSYGNAGMVVVGNPDNPAAADFVTDTVLTSVQWRTQGNELFSPLYGAVIWVYGDVNLGGNLDNIVYWDSTSAARTSQSLATNLGDRWRVTVIAFGSIDVAGTVRYASGISNNNFYAYGFVAGRDIQLRGNNNSFQCNSTDCDGSPTSTTADYAGSFVAHEQIEVNGNPGVNGFMIAEDRAACDTFVSGMSSFHGDLTVHYDCNNPFDPWRSATVRMRDWEEQQRVQ